MLSCNIWKVGHLCHSLLGSGFVDLVFIQIRAWERFFVLRLRLMIPLSFFSVFEKWMDLWKGKSPLLEKPRLPQIQVKEVDGPDTDSPRIFSWNISLNIVTQLSNCIANWREIICWVDVIGAGVASVQLRWKCEIGWNPSVGTRFISHNHQSQASQPPQTQPPL